MLRIPTTQAPTSPGEMLLEEFLIPMGITQQELADGIMVPFQRVNDIVHGRRGISPSTALRLARFFGNSVEFWMNLQLALDVYEAEHKEQDTLNQIRPHLAAV
jgi:antitoxin HigA-1